MHICTYENIHICVYAHMNRRAYDNDSGRVLEHLFGAQPVAQNRTPVWKAIAAGLRRRAVENQPSNTKKPVVRLSLTNPDFFAGIQRRLAVCLARILWRPCDPRALAPRLTAILYSVIYLGGALIFLTSLSELSITYLVQFVNYFFLLISNFSVGKSKLKVTQSIFASEIIGSEFTQIL